ncbi:o-succinylbenzoate--CoA ligase [Erwinia sp. J316]|uniref:O-succinylbenzoate--CoA ligase n=1 Tax=Erwinia sorbitola TaxID=2681984 RepID=A0A6I6EWY3_9GAMM|nr:o-succinylbenzoate--CoA ligase [Erwinia sorbitola]QGU89649.1 o-succinylbenzoate--CoA ligase [Erwinia sorbitola]
MAAIADWPWRRWQRSQPDALAIDNGDKSLNWQQLAQAIDEQAAGFRLQGVSAGDLVAVRSGNSLTALLAWLGLLACGARVLGLNPQLPEPQLHQLLPGLGPDFVLNLSDSACLDFPALALLPAAGHGCERWQPEKIATLTLTSGSTGLPKAAAHTFAAHLHSAAAVVGLMSFTRDDRWLLSLPLFHVSGQGILWRWLLAGATLVIPDDGGFNQALERSSVASLVPTQLWRLLHQPALPASLRAVLLGGAHIPAELTRRAEAAGLHCYCGYGMTETASTLCARRAGDLPGVGAPLTGHQVRVVAGEIWVRSPALAAGYWLNGSLRPLAGGDGWLHTGDVGRWHRGELLLEGRRDNLFFSGGESVQPEQIERIMLTHPAVTQVFVVPRADSEYGQRPVALVESTASLEELADWAAPKLAGYQRPVAWYPLPPASSGGIKRSRHQLREWVANQAQLCLRSLA